MPTHGDDRILDAANVLATQPLYILSTAGQELFHTNMLFWLAARYPEESASVFERLGIAISEAPKNYEKVSREHKNIDLIVEYGADSLLVIENKIAAIATQRQLDAYEEKFVGKRVKFALLSLMPVMSPPPPWQEVGYQDLIDPLRHTSNAIRASFDSQLVEAYQQLVVTLVALCSAVAPQSSDEIWSLKKETREELSRIRVLPLVEKMRGNLIASHVLGATSLAANAGLSNSLGLVEYFSGPIKGTRGHRRGWQMQGDQFRLAVSTGKAKKYSGEKKCEVRERLVESLYLEHFDFDALACGKSMLLQDKSTKGWVGYNPSFVYRFRPISHAASWSQIKALCVEATLRT